MKRLSNDKTAQNKEIQPDLNIGTRQAFIQEILSQGLLALAPCSDSLSSAALLHPSLPSLSFSLLMQFSVSNLRRNNSSINNGSPTLARREWNCSTGADVSIWSRLVSQHEITTHTHTHSDTHLSHFWSSSVRSSLI